MTLRQSETRLCSSSFSIHSIHSLPTFQDSCAYFNLPILVISSKVSPATEEIDILSVWARDRRQFKPTIVVRQMVSGFFSDMVLLSKQPNSFGRWARFDNSHLALVSLTA
jgi:hypothetical protein